MTNDKATALREAAERVNSVAQRLGPENIYEALQQYPQATSWDRTDAFAFDLRALLAERERLRAALLALANAADEVGVRYFDSDDLSPTVEAMQSATLEARQALEATDDQ